MRLLRDSLILILLIFFEAAFPQDIQNLKRYRKEIITVKDSLHGFKREVLEENITSSATAFVISYSSLETVGKVKLVYLNNSGKEIHSDVPPVTDIQSPSTSFYTCVRAKKIVVEKSRPFKLHYTSDCSDLILLSSISLSSTIQVDTFYSEVYIPQGYHLSYNIPYPEMLTYFRVDSSLDHKSYKYSFVAVPKIKSGSEPLWLKSDDGIRKKDCRIRLIVTPGKYAGRESEYFSNRLNSLYANSVNLNESSRKFFDSLTESCVSNDSVINTVFKFIRDKIKYLDVEVGYGFFVPEEVNHVLLQRQGDCKSMSNLLCQALRNKGIDAYLAVTATVDNGCDMNFPSLSSGNHMICVVKSKDRWIFLDPTDKKGNINRINPGIQGMTAFVIGYQGGIFIPIPVENAALNAENFTYRLDLIDNHLEGSFEYVCTGGSMEMMNQMLSTESLQQRDLIAAKFIGYLIHNSLATKTVIMDYTDSIRLKCNLQFGPSMYTTTTDLGYLSLDMLPPPLKFSPKDPEGCDILIGYAILSNVDVIVNFGRDIEILKCPKISFEEGDFHFMLTCKSDKNLLYINYTFRFEDNIVKETDIPLYRKFENFLDSNLKQVVSIK